MREVKDIPSSCEEGDYLYKLPQNPPSKAISARALKVSGILKYLGPRIFLDTSRSKPQGLPGECVQLSTSSEV
jgi:hypothetical protein